MLIVFEFCLAVLACAGTAAGVKWVFDRCFAGRKDPKLPWTNLNKGEKK